MNSNSRDSLIKALKEIDSALWEIHSRTHGIDLPEHAQRDASISIADAIKKLQSDETIP